MASADLFPRWPLDLWQRHIYGDPCKRCSVEAVPRPVCQKPPLFWPQAGHYTAIPKRCYGRRTPGRWRDQATLFEINMKTILRISLILNLALLGSLIYFLTNQRKPAAVTLPVVSEAKPMPALTKASMPPARTRDERQPFRWDQLVNPTSYRAFIANLRAIGCPEPTVEDIVRGDADRAFSWKRDQLGLDGSGDGPWSRQRETQLVASLLGLNPPPETTALAQSGENPAGAANGAENAAALKMASPSYPLFLQDMDWKALGFTTEQQATIAQVRQQFISATANLPQDAGSSTSQNSGAASANNATSANGSASSPDSSDSAALTQWQNALQDANGQLQAFMGAQAYMAYEQQQYYVWFKSQLAAGGGNF